MKKTAEKRQQMVAENIRKIREFRNYTQEYMAAKLGISQNAYSKIELGYSKITLDRFFLISELLEITVGKLLLSDDNELLVITEQAEAV